LRPFYYIRRIGITSRGQTFRVWNSSFGRSFIGGRTMEL
jgi:hypothetical protein